MRAPKVVAKGVNLVAARIREIAAENNVPLLEAPPLARALYHNVELDREIPGPLYGAVAEVLAWVYQLRRFKTEGGDEPVAPTELDVPAELDKGGVSDDEAEQEAADTLNPAATQITTTLQEPPHERSRRFPALDGRMPCSSTNLRALAGPVLICMILA